MPSGLPKSESGRGRDQSTLPFNQAKQDGISPTSSLIPAGTDLPPGTPFTVRLESSISSASARTGDGFGAVLDEAITLQGKVVVSAGTPVSVTVSAVKRTASLRAPAYLRVRATSLVSRGKIVRIESSSIFAKAGFPKAQEAGTAASGNFEHSSRLSSAQVHFVAGQRLTFRLTAPVVLPR